MRIEKTVTAISWIPSEAIEGLPKVPFELGIGHYDEPPPDRLNPDDLPRLRDEDRFREANHLKAWVEVEDDRIVNHGQAGEAVVGSTTFKLGPKDVIFAGVAYDTLRSEPEATDDAVRFVQTVGGRARFPAPLDLRRRGPARAEGGHDRLQNVVPRVARRADAVGRGGRAGRRDRGGERARAAPLARDHAGRGRTGAEAA